MVLLTFLRRPGKGGKIADMRIGRELAQTLAPLVDFVYPPRCPACGDAIGAQGGLCLACWNSLASAVQPVPGSGTIDSIAAATHYGDVSRKLILAFKHGKRVALAPLLARMMARVLVPDANRLVVPVPLHRWRLWQRGFNQSALLAQELEKLGAGQVVVDGLLRRKRTPSLGGLGRGERHRVLESAIVVDPRRAGVFAGRDVLLVDDVFTTGATATASARALKAAGARSVTLSCFAKVVDR